ncbi:MAG: hypothetical protein AAGG38_03065 [Planctomycetota bacterium]
MIFPDTLLLWTVWIGSALVWLGLSVVVVRRWKLPQKPAPWVILGVAALVRLGYVAAMPPALSDDIWRYVFDGRTLVDGGNPYAVSPAEVIQALDTGQGPESVALAARYDPAGERWLGWINNPTLVTIYQPASQYVFAGATLITDVVTGGRWTADAAQRVYRAVFSLFDLAIVLMLLRKLRGLGRSAWWAVLYAWSPLVVTEVAWSGHQDGIGIAAMVGCLLIAPGAARAEGSSRSVWAAAVAAGVCLGLAAGVKPIVLPLALPLGWHLVREAGWRRGLLRTAAAAAGCVGTLGLLFLPLALMDGGLTGMLETSREFVGRWRFNGSIHALLESAWREPLGVEGAKLRADQVAGGLLLAVLTAATFAHRVPWRAAMTYLFAMVCLSSTAHPWYLLWATALLPVAWASGKSVVSPAVWVAALTMPWSYIAWVHYINGGAFDGRYQPGLAVTWAVWVPVYAAVGWGAWAVARQIGAERRGHMTRPPSGRG